MASSYAGEVANWISMKLSDAYHGAANTLANRTGDESIRRGKSMLEEAIDNELKAVLEEWKKTPPQAINPNVLSQEAATNVTNKLKTTPSTLSTRDNALLGAIITATGDIALNDAAQSMFEKFNNTVATATELGLLRKNSALGVQDANKRFPNSQNTATLLTALIHELNNKATLTPAEKNKLREEIHAVAYDNALKQYDAQQQPQNSIAHYINIELNALRDQTRITKGIQLDSEKTIFEQSSLLSTNNWPVAHTALVANVARLKNDAETWYKSLPQAQTQAQPTLQQVQDSLLDAFATERNQQPQNPTKMDEIRNQIHAVAYAMADEEITAKKTQQPIHKLFADKLEKLRTNKQLDHVPSDLSSLTKETMYDSLQFMDTAIKAEQGNNPHDTNKTPNLLELINDKLETIADKVGALQQKAEEADQSQNPIHQQALEKQAHDILRLHGELGTLLNSKHNRDLLHASMSKVDFEALRQYLIALEAQQQLLVQMAGKNTPRFAPIPISMLVGVDNDRTAAIAKKGNLHGGISFREKDQYGNWGSSVLKNDKEVVVTGLTRTEIFNAIARAEDKLRKIDPNYKITVTEDNDGTIHYDTGSRANREVLHKQFRLAFDEKEDAKAKAAASATTAVQHTAAPAASTTAVQQQSISSATGGASSAPRPSTTTDTTATDTIATVIHKT